MDSDEPAVLLIQARTIEQSIYQLRTESCRLTRKAHRIERERARNAERSAELAYIRRISGDMEASDENTD